MPQPNAAKFEWARAAFAAAHGRFQNSLGQQDQQEVWTALGETLFWISALNDTYVGAAEAKAELAMRDVLATLPADENSVAREKAIRKAREKGFQAFTKFRNEDQYGRAVTGLTIPRNSVVHALGNVVMEQPVGSDILWQPTFVSIEDMNLDRPQGKAAKAVLEASMKRPIRYQLRDANYFFIRRQTTLDQFMDELDF